MIKQHDLTPRIYVLHKITTALKFVSYINQKLRPSYQTALNLHILKISGRSARERAEQLASGGGAIALSYPPPPLLLMTHHEKTRLKALP